VADGEPQGEEVVKYEVGLAKGRKDRKTNLMVTCRRRLLSLRTFSVCAPFSHHLSPTGAVSSARFFLLPKSPRCFSRHLRIFFTNNNLNRSDMFAFGSFTHYLPHLFVDLLPETAHRNSERIAAKNVLPGRT
jgi:hypothetical protein